MLLSLKTAAVQNPLIDLVDEQMPRIFTAQSPERYLSIGCSGYDP